jgi:hypothetical protein
VGYLLAISGCLMVLLQSLVASRTNASNYQRLFFRMLFAVLSVLYFGFVFRDLVAFSGDDAGAAYQHVVSP